VFAVTDASASFVLQISSLRAGIVKLTIIISMMTSRDDLTFSSTNLAREVTRSAAYAVKDASSSSSAEVSTSRASIVSFTVVVSMVARRGNCTFSGSFFVSVVSRSARNAVKDALASVLI